ncbi:oligoendopeptidase F [Metasolibacillus meyeri]|uniref:Oligopeptidase F n=1 Tax=Metasolibacillus meyeri TaxID=1071052 RepID=A0AAW9NY78_9BACL|nr:oligoendopeptidase F [Metasolibacillus meyeri]MEC1180601.1 oligoendopeptidase F [Metasolibacillus meyeri]
MTTLKRSEVNVTETWNLDDLFTTEQQFEAAIEDVKAYAVTTKKAYKGNVSNAEKAVEVISAYEKYLEKMMPITTYAFLAQSVDQTNSASQLRSAKVSQLSSSLNAKLSFIQSELLQLNENTLQEASKLAPQYAHFISKLMRQKRHQLHPEAEKALAAFGTTFGAAFELYYITKLVDLQFPNFEVDGTSYPLSFNAFEGDWEFENDLALRRAAFNAFHQQLRHYQHTMAKTYDTHIQREKTEADLRGYPSVFDYLLQSQEVDRTLYDRQIDLIMKELAPHMRRYAKLLQKVHGIERMTFADLKISLDPAYEPQVSIEEARKYVKDGLAILGDDYAQMLDRAFGERWIDFAQNSGKSNGAFCSSPFGYHPYVLISWTSRMKQVFVLAHELGHAGHFYLTNSHQNIFSARPSMYFIEAPSTMNEMLMAHHLLQSANDARFKRWVIAKMVSRTYYHQFVTHLLEGAYQRKVYEIVDAGGAVNATKLNELKRSVLEEFWGDTIEITEGAELTWMRQLHYYKGLYPYTYSAGLTIATEALQRILTEGETAVTDWLEMLKAGGSKTPIELAKMAGVDITTEEPLRNTIAYIGSLIDELESLTEALAE